MKKTLFIGGIVAVALVLGFIRVGTSDAPVGFGGSDSLPTNAKEYDQLASRSTQGLIKSGAGCLFSVDVYNYTVGERYLQFFDMNAPVVPSRAASLSAPAIYAASTSWASAGQIIAKPITSWFHWASASFIVSIPIPPATSSTSPGILRLDSSDFGPALGFSRQLIYGISSSFGSYASSGVETLKVIFRAHYE